HGPFGGVDRNRETDAAVVAGAAGAPNLGVDADHAAPGVEKRSSGVALRDRGIGLDRIDHLVGAHGDRVDRPMDRRDDAHRKRVLVAERTSDRSHRLAEATAADSPSGTGLRARALGWTRIS